ncbi:DUF4411 family protein [Patescibacteria group bacterium]|nr:DUF4411 family protein [Patescibacteria group bacterium]
MATKYTIDTCSINDFLQPGRAYDRRVFTSAWDFIDQCCDSGEIISHREVYEEILLGNVLEVLKWARIKDNFFKDYDLPREADFITKIGEKFPNFLYQKKDTVAHADPWLVAQAYSNKLTIITSEKGNNQSSIPFIANKFGVKTLDIISFLKEKKIKI